MEEAKKEVLHTYGFDLLTIVDEAKLNGNLDFAHEVEKRISDLQKCYDVIAQKNTSTGGENLWNIGVEYLLNM